MLNDYRELRNLGNIKKWKDVKTFDQLDEDWGVKDLELL